MKHISLTLAFTLGLASAALAVQPDEILDDPVLEERARTLSADLRCLVCRNESIDDSNAPLARDLRLLVRERLVAGDSNQEAMDYIVDRYGEYVLLKPTTAGANWLLWAAGPLMLLLAAGVSIPYVRKRAKTPPKNADGLSEAEQARLKELMEE
jgi:cytochrome c-type biogenesis protein CcmH